MKKFCNLVLFYQHIKLKILKVKISLNELIDHKAYEMAKTVARAEMKPLALHSSKTLRLSIHSHLTYMPQCDYLTHLYPFLAISIYKSGSFTRPRPHLRPSSQPDFGK